MLRTIIVAYMDFSFQGGRLHEFQITKFPANFSVWWDAEEEVDFPPIPQNRSLQNTGKVPKLPS